MIGEQFENAQLFDIGEEFLRQETAGVQDELGFAALVVGLFVKTVKARRCYPPEYPQLKALQQEFITRACRFLEAYHTLVLHITEKEFVVNGQPVYTAADLKSSLPFLFYRDGVRELRFIEGATERQFTELIELITQAEHLNQLEDDIVTLLWERDFTHIEYLAIDDFLEETEILIPENVEEFREHLAFQPVAHHEDLDIDMEGLPLAKLAPAVPEVNTEYLRSHRDVFVLSHEEVHALRDAVRYAISPLSITHTSAVLFNLFTLERNPEIFQVAVEIQRCILESLVDLRAYRQAGDLLVHTHQLRCGFDPEDWQHALLSQIVGGATEPALLERVATTLRDSAGELPLDELQRFLTLLPSGVIPRLIGMLAEAQDARVSAMLCEALVEMGRDDMEQFVPFLIDRRWELVRHILDLLSRIGQDRIIPYLDRAFAHSDPRIRREIVQTAAGIDGARTERLLIRALSDTDEEVRCLAATGLGRRRNMTALAPLLHAVHAKTFRQRPLAEIKAMLHGIGLSGSNHALETLRELMEFQTWFHRVRADAIREYAAHALAMIGTPEARAMLEEGAESGSHTLRKACRQALDAMRQ